MSSQDVSPFSDASIHQARRQSGVLTPSSQSICHDDIGNLGSKKRKRDGNSLEDLLKDTFVVKVGNPFTYFYNTMSDSKIAIPIQSQHPTSNFPTHNITTTFTAPTLISRHRICDQFFAPIATFRDSCQDTGIGGTNGQSANGPHS